MRGLSEHLLYELRMLRAVADHLQGFLFGSSAPWGVENALLESFTIQARGLFDFFTRQPGDSGVWADDALACDYFPPGGWARVRPTMAAALEPLRGRTGTEIAHISYRRLDVAPEAKGWAGAMACGPLRDPQSGHRDRACRFSNRDELPR